MTAAGQAVHADTVEAIDAVRGIGNIGAHMEKDIDVIVDIDPAEAAALIGLTEMLLREWYVARHDRTQRLKELAKIAASVDRQDGATKGTPTGSDRALVLCDRTGRRAW
jgi:hypothetical protein